MKDGIEAFKNFSGHSHKRTKTKDVLTNMYKKMEFEFFKYLSRVKLGKKVKDIGY